MNKSRFVLLSAFALLGFATLLRAQGTGGGCVDSRSPHGYPYARRFCRHVLRFVRAEEVASPRRQEVMQPVPSPLIMRRMSQCASTGFFLQHFDSPIGDEVVELQRTGSLPAGFYAGLVLVLVAAGSLSLSSLWQRMFHLWATDPLRSIGAVFSLVACVGVLAAWRRLGWIMNGTFFRFRW